MFDNKNITSQIQSLYHIISTRFKIDGIYLFGSYAKGTPHGDSDIDIAILSNDFEGIRFFDRLKVSKVIINKTYPRLDYSKFEIHPYKTSDFTEENPFVSEILRTGIKIV